MRRDSNRYTILFALIVCVMCSAVLTFFATELKDRQTKNIELDKKINILKAFGYAKDIAKLDGVSAIEAFYETHVEGIVLDPTGRHVEGLVAGQIDIKIQADLLPVFLAKDDGQVVSYAIPVLGKGLWSELWGYLALESDLNTVRGITFFKHGETPGLGGEISEPWFQDNFVGKKILDDSGALVGVEVVKGKTHEVYGDNAVKISHAVDGISGATMTAKGVTAMLLKDLKRYQAYFDKVRGEQS